MSEPPIFKAAREILDSEKSYAEQLHEKICREELAKGPLPEGCYICEFCGCRTDAKTRACCPKGRDADQRPSNEVVHPVAEELFKEVYALRAEIERLRAALQGIADLPGPVYMAKDLAIKALRGADETKADLKYLCPHSLDSRYCPTCKAVNGTGGAI